MPMTSRKTRPDRSFNRNKVGSSPQYELVDCHQSLYGQSPMPSRLTSGRLSKHSLTILLVFLAGCGTPFSQQETVTLSAESPSTKFVMQNRVGDVTIRTDPNAQQVSATVTKTGKGSSPDEARKALQDIRVMLARAESAGVVEATAE